MANMYINAMTDVWNSVGTTFSAIKMSVTDTASAAGSKLIDLRGGATGTTSLFSVDKAGNVAAAGTFTATGGVDSIGGTLTGPTVVDGSSKWFKGLIHGLTLSNNVSDATNDIDIALGVAASDSTTPTLIDLTAGITKQLDAAWAVGTNAGGLDTGAIANTTYHVWLIRRPDTGVVDALFSASATSPTMPTDYTQKRRIGSILRLSNTITAFTQVGDIFRRNTGLFGASGSSTVASSLQAQLVPLGIQVAPLLAVTISTSTSQEGVVYFGSVSAGSAGIAVANSICGSGDSLNAVQTVVPPCFITNTSAQLYFRFQVGTGAPSYSVLHIGWIDTRGRLY